MRVLCLVAVLLAAVAAHPADRSGPRRYRVRDYDYRYDYGYDRRPYYPERRPFEEESEEEVEEVDDKVYTFHIHEADHGAYLYHDEEGRAVGFEIDLLHEVCERAGKECYFILDKGKNCWYNEGRSEYPGKGLMAGWYDGCLGFFPTVERMNSFTFTKSFTENMKVSLYYKQEGLMQKANRTVGFVENWPLNPQCLDRQAEYADEEYQSVFFSDIRSMMKAVLNDEIDAAIAPKVVGMELERRGKALSHTDYFSCTTDGAGVMTRYGSDVVNWWDKTFNEMVDSGDFRKLCLKASKVHGAKGKIYCA